MNESIGANIDSRPGSTESAELEVTSLSKFFDGVPAVADVSFRLEKDEFLSLLGPSGCGKTTTLRMLAGFVEPDVGQIWLRGKDITHVPPYHRDVGLLFQNYALFPHMSVAENVGFGPRMRGEARAAIAERVRWALDLVQLGGYEQRRPGQLSGGQQQRVAVARVLAAGASVLLLDEPFSNLDAKLRLHMQDELKELQVRLGFPTIHVTHDQEEAMALSDRIIIMNAGRIEQGGSPETIYGDPASAFVADFMGRCNRLSTSAAIAGAVVDLGPAGRLSCEARESDGEALELFVRPEHVEVAAAGSLSGRGNVLSGEVVRSIYLGPRTNLHLRLANGDSLLAQQPNPAGKAVSFAAGTPVDIHIPAAALRRIPQSPILKPTGHPSGGNARDERQ